MKAFTCRAIPSARLLLLIVLMPLVTAGCGTGDDSTAGPSFSRVTPGASFDWSMPARFGLDQDGDGLMDYPRTPEQLNPASWTVNFDACAIPNGLRYNWHVGKRLVASVASCLWTHEFSAEGRYDVALHVIQQGGPGAWAEQVVTVQDWLVVSFGDSYASGEGVPEVPGANDQLVASIEATLQSLEDARRSLDAARVSLDLAIANLQTAFENKGLAESVLVTQRQRLSDFLDACNIQTFKDIAVCANFLAGLPLDTYQTASDHFHQAVNDAQERVNDLTQAYQAAQAALGHAQAALQSAQDLVANLQSAIALLQAGLGPAKWQAPYTGEDWNGGDCHRSANAAPARAALALEESDPRTSVTFVHFACSGAQINRDRASLTKQIPWAEALLGPREIDAVLLSIGGNDAGFANIATACAVQQPCYVDDPAFDPAAGIGLCTVLGVLGFGQQCTDFFGFFPTESANRLVADGVAALPAKYQELAQEVLPQLSGLLDPLAMGEPATRLRSSRVYITEYVDMTRDDNGAYCTQDLTNPLGTIPAITPDELAWLDVNAAGSINQAVADAAAAHGWNAVGGIYGPYATHGYCADDHWVVRIYESLLRQGDPGGVAHPNVAGHRHNGQAIVAALTAALYPDGPGAAPRAPDQQLGPGLVAVSGGASPR